MKILMIAPQPFFSPRGTPISVYQRLYALSCNEHQVDLLTYHLGEDITFPGVRIFRTPRIPFINGVRTGPSLKKVLLDFLIFLKAFHLLATNPYQVIHSHEEASFMAMVLAKIFNRQHLYDMHSSLPHQLKISKYGKFTFLVRIFEFLERRVLNSCDAVIPISPDLEEYIKQINPYINTLTIENLGLPVEAQDADLHSMNILRKKISVSGRLPVVYTGSLETHQGINLLIKSVKKVKEFNSQAVFILVGGNPDQVAYYKREVKEHQLEDWVWFMGSVSMEEVSAYMGIAEVLISPRENGMPIPLKIYSYLNSGKPIIATRIDAHTRVLNEKISLLVDPKPQALADGILKLLHDPILRKDLGLRAKAYSLENYNFSDYRKKIERIYKTLPGEINLKEQTAQVIKE
jgi:glycosyltransferase involved in cell wall biosynthesis